MVFKRNREDLSKATAVRDCNMFDQKRVILERTELLLVRRISNNKSTKRGMENITLFWLVPRYLQIVQACY